MSSFEPIVLIFGSPQCIGSAHLRLPVSSSFAFDVKVLEDILNVSPPLSNPSLNRYFIILLQAIDEDLLSRLKCNHRVINVYE